MGMAWSCCIMVLNHPSTGSSLLCVDFMTESLSKLIPWSGVCVQPVRKMLATTGSVRLSSIQISNLGSLFLK